MEMCSYVYVGLALLGRGGGLELESDGAGLFRSLTTQNAEPRAGDVGSRVDSGKAEERVSLRPSKAGDVEPGVNSGKAEERMSLRPLEADDTWTAAGLGDAEERASLGSLEADDTWTAAGLDGAADCNDRVASNAETFDIGRLECGLDG